ncbi:MAG: zf-HC2 domain-containing protein [Candidatus Sericytochromatia bacterium]|nr:zf-HC2 domain-containing protein [Candidatus Tanganyikabacteria bacterium]
MMTTVFRIDPDRWEALRREAATFSTAPVRKRVFANLLAREGLLAWLAAHGAEARAGDSFAADSTVAELLDVCDVHVGARRINACPVLPGSRRVLADFRALMHRFYSDVYVAVGLRGDIATGSDVEAEILGATTPAVFDNHGTWDERGHAVLDLSELTRLERPEDFARFPEAEPPGEIWAFECDEVRPRIPEYWKRRIDPAAIPMFEAHMLHCADCRQDAIGARLAAEVDPPGRKAEIVYFPAALLRRTAMAASTAEPASFAISGGDDEIPAARVPGEGPWLTSDGRLEGALAVGMEHAGKTVRLTLALSFGPEGATEPAFDTTVTAGGGVPLDRRLQEPAILAWLGETGLAWPDGRWALEPEHLALEFVGDE